MRRILAGALALLLVLPAVLAQDKDKQHQPEDLAVGKVAPDIEGQDIDGKAFKLSDYRGKIVVLDFWGNW